MCIRDRGSSTGNDEREQTLNQLLTEMDGFEGNNGVIILAATNRPESLDPALTRPGRFDRRVPVELPDLKGREAILQVHAKKIKVAEDVDFNKIARMASGASGAELANIVNEAALRAVRDGRRFATQADLEESIEVVIAGYQKKNAIMTDEEKKIVSYHEIGHALVAAMQTHSAPVQKITIVPRTSGALGYTMQVEEGNHYLMSKAEMENKIATLTGGRAAEEVVFHSVTTGASNDIEQATKLARAMITRYGMSDDFDMVALETVNNQYLGGDASLACSAETQTKIDQRVVELVKAQHEKAVNILTENRAKLDEPMTACREMTSSRFGTLRRISVRRISSASSHLGASPLTAPKRIASSVEMTVEPTPMNSDSRPPYQIIEKMSRPIVSVPNRNSRHGAAEQ